MSHDDFDVEGLASYLHLEPAKVARMADRGKLPARKVGGDWHFSRSEIHHWLEARIGASDDTELDRLEAALDRDAGGELPPDLEAQMPLAAVAVPLEARTRASVITAMVDLAAATGWLWDPRAMAEAVRKREDMLPTAMDIGVALLHPRRPMPGVLQQPCVALGITRQGIPFGNPRGLLTDIFFLVCSVSDRGHLQTLARISRLLNDAEFLSQLRGAEDAETARNLLLARERAVLG